MVCMVAEVNKAYDFLKDKKVKEEADCRFDWNGN